MSHSPDGFYGLRPSGPLPPHSSLPLYFAAAVFRCSHTALCLCVFFAAVYHGSATAGCLCVSLLLDWLPFMSVASVSSQLLFTASLLLSAPFESSLYIAVGYLSVVVYTSLLFCLTKFCFHPSELIMGRYPPAIFGPVGLFSMFFKFYDGMCGFSCPSSHILSRKRAARIFPQLDISGLKYAQVTTAASPSQPLIFLLSLCLSLLYSSYCHLIQ